MAYLLFILILWAGWDLVRSAVRDDGYTYHKIDYPNGITKFYKHKNGIVKKISMGEYLRNTPLK